MIRKHNPYWKNASVSSEFDLTQLLPETLPISERFETLHDVKVRSDAISKRLAGRHKKLIFELSFLEDCKNNFYDCCKVFCPCCGRHFRRWVSGQILEKLNQSACSAEICTLILDRIPTGKLSDVNIQKVSKALKRQLMRAGFSDARAIGGLEVAYSASESSWVLHAHLMILNGSALAFKILRHRLKKISGDRALKCQSIKNPVVQCSYLIKFLTYYRPLRQVGRTRSIAIPLPNGLLSELIIWQNLWKFEDFLILYRCRRRGLAIVDIDR
jgi:hypothetical protein